MRTSSPNGTIPNVWDQNSDLFDHTQLVANWDALDVAVNAPRTSNAITQAASLPGGLNNTTDRGKVIYLTAPDQSFVAGDTVVWIGTDWRNLRRPEILAALPTLNNFDGRTVLLSAANGGFAAWTLVRYLTSAWYIVNQGIEAQASLPAAAGYAGRVIILTSASGGFNAYDVVRSTGSAWALVGPQPVAPGFELAYASVATDITTTNTASPGDTIATFGAATFENVKYYFSLDVPKLTLSVPGNVNFLLQEATSTVGSIMQNVVYTGTNYRSFNIRMPFTPSAGSHTYNVKWYISTAGTATINTTSLAPAILSIAKA